MQIENNRDQIERYQNVGTKLTVTPKFKDQNSVFAKFFFSSLREKNNLLLTGLFL